MVREASEATGWGDATVPLSLMLYWYFGDPKVLSDQYASIQRWVDHLERRACTRQSWRTRLLCWGGGIGEARSTSTTPASTGESGCLHSVQHRGHSGPWG